ncbi:SH3 domain-containing protein [Vibrio parahaemolyticus]|uniref:SH3 domain-containing protein n=3 Tax=Vibrio parahaemolyticus TaxID=670 RepID=UPI00248ADD92|nr:SH3 domain-containing protein [Vibrio parahaemolyticus]
MTESSKSSKTIEALSFDNMVKQMPSQELSALTKASEVAKQMSLYESSAPKQASEVAKQMSLYESSALKQASEVAKQMSLYESSALKQASEVAKQMSLYESSALKQARGYLKSFAMQEAASLIAASSISRMFVANDSAAIQAVREMSGSILKQDLAGILDSSNAEIGFEINADAIEDAVTQFSTAPALESSSSILDWYNNQPPSMQLIIGLIFSYWIGVFCNLSMPLYEDWSQLFSDTNSRVAPKLIVNEARKEYDLTDLKNYRFVVATILHVRNEPTINSDILDELENGKTVKLIEKSKRWVLVEYLCDDTGEYKTGWVFARYLHRFEI